MRGLTLALLALVLAVATASPLPAAQPALAGASLRKAQGDLIVASHLALEIGKKKTTSSVTVPGRNTTVKKKSKAAKIGKIIGIVIAAIVVLLIIAAIAFFLMRKAKKAKHVTHQQPGVTPIVA